MNSQIKAKEEIFIVFPQLDGLFSAYHFIPEPTSRE
jgi:hypothetical protein